MTRTAHAIAGTEFPVVLDDVNAQDVSAPG